MKQAIIIVLSLLVFGISTAEVKSATDESYSHDLTETLIHLKFQQFIYVEKFEKKIVKGRYNKVQNDTLYLWFRHRVVSVAVEEIQAIKIKNSNTGTITLVGGIAGGFIGYTAGGGGGSNNSTMFKNLERTISIMGAIAGGAIGLGVGYGFGKATESYDIIYKYSKTDETIVTEYNVNEDDKNAFKLNIAPDLKGGMYLSATLSF